MNFLLWPRLFEPIFATAWIVKISHGLARPDWGMLSSNPHRSKEVSTEDTEKVRPGQYLGIYFAPSDAPPDFGCLVMSRTLSRGREILMLESGEQLNLTRSPQPAEPGPC